MSKGDLVELEGVIEQALGGGQYRILLANSETTVRARLGGRMRRNHIRVLPGDRVKVSVSPYDMTHGMIVFRSK